MEQNPYCLHIAHVALNKVYGNREFNGWHATTTLRAGIDFVTMQNRFHELGALFIGAILCSSAQAHLMVAQQGTLNFLDDSVYTFFPFKSNMDT